MYLLFGIGNPGSCYKHSRHNAGFLLLDYFADKLKLKFIEAKGEYLEAKGTKNNSDFVLIKPLTFVNKSGIAFLEALNNYNAEIENCLVICDDINLDFGTSRIRKAGGDGGHNGLASIIYHLGLNNFPRLRIGIRNEVFSGNLSEFVLDDFNSDEMKMLLPIFNSSSILLNEFIDGGTIKMLEAYSKLSQSSSEENFKEE